MKRSDHDHPVHARPGSRLPRFPSPRPVALIAALGIAACASAPAPAGSDGFLPEGSSVLFEAVAGDNSVEGVIEFLPAGELIIESEWATCSPRSSNPLVPDDRGRYGVRTVLPASTRWVRRSANGLRITCGDLNLALTRDGDDFGGTVRVLASTFVRERTGNCLRYFVDPKTGVRGPCMQYEEKTVERRVWTRPTPVRLTVDSGA